MKSARFAVSRSACLLTAVLLLPGCGGVFGIGGEDLRPGTYEVSFHIPYSNDTPGALMGDHEFRFRVTEPDTAASSFELLSSRHQSYTLNGEPTGWESDYLSPSTDHIIASSIQWRARWEYREHSSLAVNVTFTENDGSGFGLPYGCRGVRNVTENYQGQDCSVERVSEP